MRHILLLLIVLLVSCNPRSSSQEVASVIEETATGGQVVPILAPLIDPAKLDTLKGKRAATPRLRKACYWLEMARRDGKDLEAVIAQVHAATGHDDAKRKTEQSASLIRNVVILERLGCLNPEGMEKLRKGKAPTITKGPYTGEIVTGDHIIPRSVCPELDNCLFNLEFMPLTLNQRKSAKVTQRQIQLGRRWHRDGLLSKSGLESVLRSGGEGR